MGFAFTKRSGGYKAGLILLVIASIIFMAGFGSPYWTTYDVPDSDRNRGLYEGLWTQCASGGRSSSPCESFDFGVIGGWLHAVRALEALCLVLLIAACIYAALVNFCRSEPEPRFRILEILAGLGSLLGLVGVVVYAATRKQKSHTFDTLSVELGFRLPDRGSAYDYNWGLYLAGVGSGVAVIAAILIAVFNEDDENISDLDIDNKSDYSSHSGGNPRHVGYPRRWEGYPRSEDGDESFSRYSNKGFSRHEYDDRKRRDYDRGSRADSDDVILGRHHDEGRRQDKRDYKHRDYSRDSADISRHDDDMRHGRREGKYRDDRDRSRDSDDFSRNGDEKRRSKKDSRYRDDRDHSRDSDDFIRNADEMHDDKRGDTHRDDRDYSKRQDDDSMRHSYDQKRQYDRDYNDHNRSDRDNLRHGHEGPKRSEDRDSSRFNDDYQRQDERDKRQRDIDATRQDDSYSDNKNHDDSDVHPEEGRRRRRRRRSRGSSRHEEEQPRHAEEQPRQNEEQPRQNGELSRHDERSYTPPKSGYFNSHRAKPESETTV